MLTVGFLSKLACQKTLGPPQNRSSPPAVRVVPPRRPPPAGAAMEGRRGRLAPGREFGEKGRGSGGHGLDGLFEGGLGRRRRRPDPAHLAHVLARRGLDLGLGGGGLKAP